MKLKCNRLSRAVPLIILIMLLGVLLACHGKDGLDIGDSAIDFQLRDLHGRLHRLDDYKGKLVHLHFWADWCPRCHEEFDRMETAYRDLKRKNPDFEILGVNVDQHRVHVEEFIKMHSTTFPIMLDVGAKIARSYRVKGLPCNFFIGRDGKIKDILMGWVDEKYLEQSIRKMEH